MPGKRPRGDSQNHSDIFEQLFAFCYASDPGDSVTRNILKDLQRRMCSAEAEKVKFIRKAARDFTLEDTVMDFGLTYAHTPDHLWKIEALPETKTFQVSTGLGKFLLALIELCNDEGPY